MRSSGRKRRSSADRKESSLVASSTLIAVLGFTPWVIGADAPWAMFAFRAIGLTALGVVAFLELRSALTRSLWAARASMGCVALIAASALSAAISVHRGKSLEAMLNLLAIAGLFLTAAVVLRGGRALRGVALFEVFAAIPVAVLGLIQQFRPDLVPAGTSYPGRALGPFGQPNRLGGYLIAVIPLAIALSFASQDRTLRVALMIAASVLTLCLVSTYSRGAWIGLAAGVILLGVLVVRLPDLAPRPLLASVAALALLAPAIFYLPSIFERLSPNSSHTPTWNLPIDPEREGSASMRRAVWSGAYSAIAARPILGWGIGTFREAYDRSKSDGLKRLEAEGARTADQAHSFYLKTLTERGVLGLAALIVFLALSVAAGVAALRMGTPESRLLVVGLIASVVALLTHAVMEDNPSLVPHGTLLFANLGLLAAAAPGPKETSARRMRWSASCGILAALLGVGLSSASALAATEAREGSFALQARQFVQAGFRYANATRIAPWDDSYAIARARAAVGAAQGGSGIASLREAESSYRSAISLNGSDPVTRHELARLYLSHVSVFGPSGTASALQELRAALDQNPHYAEIRNDLGVALLASGDRAGAREAFHQASEGRLDFVDPLLNLATLALQDRDAAEARRMVGLALERNPGSTRAAAMRESIPH